MANYIPGQSKPKSLAAQIRDAERQLLLHQRGVGVRASKLVWKIREQMIAPASLLLAGGIGFIIGELTKRPSPIASGDADDPRAAEPSPLMTALNLVTSVHTLYMALPLSWMMKSFHQTSSSGQPPERRSHPDAASDTHAAPC